MPILSLGTSQTGDVYIPGNCRSTSVFTGFHIWVYGSMNPEGFAHYVEVHLGIVPYRRVGHMTAWCSFPAGWFSGSKMEGISMQLHSWIALGLHGAPSHRLITKR